MSGSKKNVLFPDVDWYCNNCYDYLSSQPGFHDDCGNWRCTKCGHISPINKYEIINDDSRNNESNDFEDYNDILSYPGCAACGNPVFPNCKSSCPMFDD